MRVGDSKTISIKFLILYDELLQKLVLNTTFILLGNVLNIVDLLMSIYAIYMINIPNVVFKEVNYWCTKLAIGSDIVCIVLAYITYLIIFNLLWAILQRFNDASPYATIFISSLLIDLLVMKTYAVIHNVIELVKYVFV